MSNFYIKETYVPLDDDSLVAQLQMLILDSNLSVEETVKLSGYSYSTIKKIRDGKCRGIRVTTYANIVKALTGKQPVLYLQD